MNESPTIGTNAYYDGYGHCALSGTDSDDVSKRLVDLVTKSMREGWIPLGGMVLQVVLTEPEPTYIMAQAIVLPKDGHQPNNAAERAIEDLTETIEE